MISAAAYKLQPQRGILAVALCMGGAAETAVGMPDPAQRPGSFFFATLTLAAALWSRHQTMREQNFDLAFWGLLFLCYWAGAVGRYLVPTNAFFVDFFSEDEPKKTDGDAKADKKEEKPGDAKQ